MFNEDIVFLILKMKFTAMHSQRTINNIANKNNFEGFIINK